MTRPLVWALGILAGAAVFGLGVSGRLQRQGWTNAPAPAAQPAGPSLLVLHADLRGHFMVHPSVEGRTVRMMVDTGASVVALSEEDARIAGITVKPSEFTRMVGTANGVLRAAPVRIAEMRLGAITVRGVEALVVPRGRLGTSLLGMSFLRRLNGFEMSGGRLTLRG